MDLTKSFFSAVNRFFVSNPYPILNEQIRVTFRAKDTIDIKRVMLRMQRDGEALFLTMERGESKNGYRYYHAYIITRNIKTDYYFLIITESKVYYYNKGGVTFYPPTDERNFVILSGFESPEWVKRSVFYHIFPDRFNYSGASHRVRTGEYSFNGFKTIAVDWNVPPGQYSDVGCLDFYGGDLAGITEKIPYLKELGVNALYLNPIFEARTVHRYDTVDYFNVDPHLGGDEALVSLVERLHENGIKLILDISINHTGIENGWLKKALADPHSDEAGFYYIKNGIPGYWNGVETLPQLNYNSSILRDLIYKNENSVLKKYVKPPFNIDGYRFDVGFNTGYRGADNFSHELFREIRRELKKLRKDLYILAEHWEDPVTYLEGDQWDGVMNYLAACRPVRTYAGEPDRYLLGVFRDYTGYRRTDGEDLAHSILNHYSRLPDQTVPLQYNLIDSHDIHRFHNSDVYDFETYKGLLIILYMMPGSFGLYYGDEIGLDGGWTTEECRYPMNWDRSSWNMQHFELYRTLNRIRTDEEALCEGSFNIPYSCGRSVLISRFTDRELLIGGIVESSENVSIPLNAEGACSGKCADMFTGEEFEIVDGILVVPGMGKSRQILLKHTF